MDFTGNVWLLTIGGGVAVGVIVLFVEYTYFQRRTRRDLIRTAGQPRLSHGSREYVHSSRIVISFRDLEECWRELRGLRTYDEWSSSLTYEDLEELDSSIGKAQQLIGILVRDLGGWIKSVSSNKPWGLWSLRELGAWKAKISREMSRRNYLDLYRKEDMELLDGVSDLLSQCWLQVLLLIDHLELPREYKTDFKQLWVNRITAFVLGVLSSLVATQFYR